MADPHDDQREAAERDVRRRVEYQAEKSEGASFPLTYGQDTPEWTNVLIRKLEEARAAGLRVCPHLHAAPEQPSLWLTALPDLLSCQGRECEQRLIPTLEARLGHSLKEEPGRCSVCGQVGKPVKGISVGVQTTMIRAIVCADCIQGG